MTTVTKPRAARGFGGVSLAPRKDAEPEFDELYQPNEETLAAFAEAEGLSKLTACSDLRKCGLDR
ncbi:MAG: hypothetical protein LBR38_07490 [Synergistaceae bacterium]|jgi:hypothetical protein|nr:hypothetical protein [Synergistaceae bacterium]